jgi:hypothetical protein
MGAMTRRKRGAALPRVEARGAARTPYELRQLTSPPCLETWVGELPREPPPPAKAAALPEAVAAALTRPRAPPQA